MMLKRLLFVFTLFVLLGTTALAQQTWYVNNGPTGNDGRNGLSATIPVPDDFVTGPKKTINNAISSANANDNIVIAFTGVDYGPGTGEPATIVANKVLKIQSAGGTAPVIGSVLEINTGALADMVTFNSGSVSLGGGLLLTSGTLSNPSGLVTVTGGTVTVGALATVTKVTGQLAFSSGVNFSYGANYTTGDEFPSSATIGNFTTTGGANVTLKTATITLSNTVVNTSAGGTLNLGGNTVTLLASSGNRTHDFGGGNVTNGTLAFTMTGNTARTHTVNGAVSLPTVSVNGSGTNTHILAIAQPTAITGSLSATGNVNVTTNAALATIGTTGSTANTVSTNSTGTVTISGTPTTIHGTVLLYSETTLAAGADLVFQGATTINGNVVNSSKLTVNNNNLGAATSGRITFPDANITITGNVVNNTSIEGTADSKLNITAFGNIVFNQAATNVTIQGALNNGSSTTVTGSSSAAFNSNGWITFAAITTGILRIDGGINNSASWTWGHSTNVNNGRIIIGTAGTRIAPSTIGTNANKVGAITNSSAGRSNGAPGGAGDIVIEGTAGGFFGTNVTSTGSSRGGAIKFGNENFTISGNILNTRTQTNRDFPLIQVGTAATAGATVTVGGNIVNQGVHDISFIASQDGNVGVTGSVQSTTANGVITWPNITTGAVTLGGILVSAGTVNVPATNDAALSVNGPVDISGGTVTLACNGGDALVIVGNVSLTGGTFATTGRSGVTFNSANITVGGATGNPTLTAEPYIVANPTPTSLVNFIIGSANPLIAGDLTINNTTGLAKAVEFTGGSMVIAGKLYLQAGKVHLAGAVNLIVQGNSGANDLQNAAGYTTDDNARISVNAANPQVTGAGDFGNIEFNGTTSGLIDIGSPIKVTGTVYLTVGPVDNSINNIDFDNTTVIPTIVRNSGYFLAIPTFTSNVNVTYIGGDKAVGNELPASPSTKLQNLTVATSTGNVAGKGAVTVGANTIVNGTINVYANQALVIDNGFFLNMKGASIILDGDIANNGTGILQLGAATGTTITGSGYLPSILVNAGSSGNVINATALVDNLLGADNIRGGVADFDPTTTSANGSIALGAGTASATINLAGVSFDGTDLNNIVTAHANNTLTLGANTQMSGNITHTAGTLALGGFTLTHLGTVPAITGDAVINNGTLTFGNGTSTGATVLSCVTSDVTIAANVNINLGTAATTFTIDPATAGHLILAGTLTVTKGDVVLGNGGVARNLTVIGNAVTLTANGTIDVTPTGIGTLRLNATTTPLTFTYAGTPTIARLRISKDVTLAGAGTALTVSTLFTHDGGVLNFGTKNLTFKTAFTRTAGTYAATTGYMILDANAAWTIAQGTDGFSVPNLRVTASTANNLALNNTQGTITVTTAFDLETGAQSLTTNGKLAIAADATVNYKSGAISAVPAYAGSITLVGNGFANGATFPDNIWPTTANLVKSLIINGAAAGNIINMPGGNRTVYNELHLRKGVLALGTRTLTLNSGLTIYRRHEGSVTKGSGGFGLPAGNQINMQYESAAAGDGVYATVDGDIITGIELPAIVNDFTVTRSGNATANSTLFIISGVTVNGTLTIRNDISVPAVNGAAVPPVPEVILTVTRNLVVAKEAATFTAATNPVINFAQSLVFGGPVNQTITVPSVTPPVNIGNITINKPFRTNTVTLAGGNLATGNITFVNGLIVTGSKVLYLPAPTTGAVAGGALSQGFDRSLVTDTKVSHIVGNVGKTLTNTGAIGTSTEARTVYPVGTTDEYRPAAITFNPAFGVPTNPNVTIVVSHENVNPGGAKALPIANGVAEGIDVARYPSFYWNIATTPGSVGPTTSFDLELSAGNFTDYDSPSNVRIIRRHGLVGDINNDWLLQGANDAYDNEVTAANGFSAINRGANAGLRNGGAVFTLGLKSNMFVANPIPTQNLVFQNASIPGSGPKVISLAGVFEGNIGTLSYTVQSSNGAVATASVSGANLTLSPVAIGAADITVKASDAANNDFFAYSFKVNVGLTSVEKEELPTEYALYQNFPNPFNPTTNIKFALPNESNVTLKIYNILGEEVATLVNKVMNAGFHTVSFDASKLTSGMYIYRIEAENFVQVKKMLLMK